MYRETKSGHVDTDICCPTCKLRSLWQPKDHSPCTDDWWCRGCTAWVSVDEVYRCGPYAFQVHYFDDNGQSQLRSACNEFIAQIAA